MALKGARMEVARARGMDPCVNVVAETPQVDDVAAGRGVQVHAQSVSARTLLPLARKRPLARQSPHPEINTVFYSYARDHILWSESIFIGCCVSGIP
jgi:hypothetical protein